MQNFLIFSSIPKLVKIGQFLPCGPFYDTNFSGNDCEELFHKNLETKPNDWRYRTSPVKYTYNKHYYRTEEFNQIDWSQSIVIFGCSNVFGVGVDDDDTVSGQLSRMINRPVINMGVGGSSITHALHNAVILNANYPMPFGVVNLWTEYNRTVYYYKNQVKNYGSWNFEENNYMDVWSESSYHSMTHATIASMTSKQLWKTTRYYEASFFRNTAELLQCDTLARVDYARDDCHCGYDTLKLAAEKIAEKLNL